MVHNVRAQVLPLISAVSIVVGSIVAIPHVAQAATGDIVEYPVPTGFSSPIGITAGPDANLWFTESSGNKIGQITPSGVITEFPVPTAGAQPHSIVTGPDGNLWLTETAGNKIGRLTPSGGWAEFNVPTANSLPTAIATGADGNLWFVEFNANKIGKITPAGIFTEYFVLGSPQLEGITAGPDGNVWFANRTGGAIDSITPTGSIHAISAPAGFGPNQITTGPDGNLWYTNTGANDIAKTAPTSFSTAYTLPAADGNLAGIATGPDGDMWVTSQAGNHVDRVTTSGAVTQYPIPTATSGPAGITTGPDNNIWFVETSANKIGRLAVAPVAVLPVMANAAYGGYTTSAEIQNVGAGPASVYVNYFDSSGNAAGSGDSILSLPVNATWTVRQDNGHSFPSGGAGSAKIYSNQPVASFVNEFAPGNAGDASSYTGIPGTNSSSVLLAPTIVRNAYGGYTTGIGLINAGSAPTNISVTYRDASGAAVRTQTLTGVAAGAYQSLYSGDPTLNLPDGFAGTAALVSSSGPIDAVVNETGPGGQFSSYDAIQSSATTLYAPAALNNAYGGYNTGFAIQSTSSASGVVTINYYNATGAAYVTSTSIAAYGYVGVYQGTDIPSAGAYTAKITSTVPIAGIVNETAPSATSAKQSTAYDMFAAGTSIVRLPLVENAGADGWSTGEGVMNTASTATTVTVTYYDTVTGAQVGTPDIQSVQPNAFWGLYQPNGGLPSGHRAGAVVTTTGGPVAVICNESSTSSFMSYTGQ